MECPGALYHITSRGNEGRVILFVDRHRKLFLRPPVKRRIASSIDAFAFVLMKN
jgi:hypothetical protein